MNRESSIVDPLLTRCSQTLRLHGGSRTDQLSREDTLSTSMLTDWSHNATAVDWVMEGRES